ncbi:MAG: hypothetical protein DSZ05_08310 [Sulfurospirillum sp.]|nr:MAG: hypothetical protein DSZ05_08310 [Sulfurospirillum sp.]
MKKLLLTLTLFSASLLFASHGGASANQCDLKYNHCMGDCSVKYGSDSKCVQRCAYNYNNCKAGLKTEDLVPQKAAEEAAPKSEAKAEHEHH